MSQNNFHNAFEYQFPNFIVIGAAKSATTSLCYLLGQHPEIHISNPKEPRYFALPEVDYKNEWGKYCDLFKNLPKGIRAAGEGSQIYTARMPAADWLVPKRIAQRFPKIKLFYIVRNPIDRIVSEWRMRARENPKDFVNFNIDVISPKNKRWFIDRSKYWFQISAYREVFPDEQIKILFFDDFISSPRSVLNLCVQYLGLSNWQGYTNLQKAQNAAPQNKNLSILQHLFKRLPAHKAFLQFIAKKLHYGASRRNPASSPAVLKPKWKPHVRQEVICEINDDIEKFLRFAGKPLGYWDLSGNSKSTQVNESES